MQLRLLYAAPSGLIIRASSELAKEVFMLDATQVSTVIAEKALLDKNVHKSWETVPVSLKTHQVSTIGLASPNGRRFASHGLHT